MKDYVVPVLILALAGIGVATLVVLWPWLTASLGMLVLAAFLARLIVDRKNRRLLDRDANRRRLDRDASRISAEIDAWWGRGR